MKRRLRAFLVLGLVASLASSVEATVRYGPIQLSGNLESQHLFRLDRSTRRPFQAFDLVQQRSTLRVQYEHDLVNGGRLLDAWDVPFVKQASLFAYYRLVYDSAYALAPGPFFRASDGSKAGGFESFSSGERKALAFENVLREFFIDLDLAKLPISFRIGRQQIVWGNALNFRAIDTANALDLSWHFQQEAGIFGKVGFSELRIPAWAVKALVDIGTYGPFSGMYLEGFDIPFEFTPTKTRFLPRPWALSLRNPFRGGLEIPVAVGPLTQFVQACFDTTGNRAFNAAANPDFGRANETGFCPTPGLRRTDLRQGNYDAHDPRDVNQFGARLGGTFAPLQIGFTLNYKYQRHVVDATGGTAAKSAGNFVTVNSTQFLQVDPHTTTDPLTGEQTDVLGYLRIPIEFYYPYVSVFGLSLDYFDEFTAAVYNFEIGATKGVAIANLSPDPAVPGLRRSWVYEMALLIDRPTWIRFLNPRSTFTTFVQGNLSMVPDRERVRRGPNPFDRTPPQDVAFLGGDVGVPSATRIPGQFRDQDTLDQRRRFEYLTIVAMQTFYWGGSLSPFVIWVSDWTNAPSMQWQIFVQYLPHPNLILEPGFRIFWTNGRAVDDRYSIGRFGGRSEFQLKVTYQF